jgi:hypothetical protein
MGKIIDLNDLAIPDAADFFVVRDVSDVLDKDKKMTLGKMAIKSGTPIAGNVAGWIDTNKIGDGGFPISDVARLNVTQTFAGATTVSGTLTVAPSVLTGTALDLSMPSTNVANAIVVRYGGVARAYWYSRASDNILQLNDFDAGTSFGSQLRIGRNNNATTPGAGSIILTAMNGGNRVVWPDAAGQFRIHTASPTNSNDTAGTVVGTQTSFAASKNLSNDLSPLDEVLERVQAGADAVRRFVYKSGAFSQQEFEGVVTDEAPAYGMDRDAEHPQGKSLNEIQILGDLLRLVADLTKRVDQLESKIDI